MTDKQCYEQKYHEIMGVLRDLRKFEGRHGKCNPRLDRACAYCNAVDDLERLVSDYRGPRIVLAKHPIRLSAEAAERSVYATPQTGERE
jgi:hypothetical protein